MDPTQRPRPRTAATVGSEALMTDDHDERVCQHEAMLQGLARIWDAQHAMNQDQRDLNQRLPLAIERIDWTLAQQTECNADVKTTLARVETLHARMLPTGENGREA
jgi:hypothetical protein